MPDDARFGVVRHSSRTSCLAIDVDALLSVPWSLVCRHLARVIGGTHSQRTWHSMNCALERCCGRLHTVTASNGDSPAGIEQGAGTRCRSRLAREGCWFAALVSGIVVLAAMPWYHYIGVTTTSPGCTTFGEGFICQSNYYPEGFFGIGLGSSAPGFLGNSSPWATTYWVISLFLGLCAVVGFYWWRSRKLENARWIWPIVTVGLGAFLLGAASRNWFSIVPSQLTIWGMQALLLIGLGLIVLAVVNRGWAFSFFVAGFLCLAFVSCLYNVINLFQRLDIGRHWPVSDWTLPNLILPGIYLLLGAAAFWVFPRWRVRFRRH